MILDLIYDIYFGISYGNSRIYFYYSDHIMIFLDLIFMIFYFYIYVKFYHTYALSRLRPCFLFNPKYISITLDLIHGARPVGAEQSSGYAILKLLTFPGTYFG